MGRRLRSIGRRPEVSSYFGKRELSAADDPSIEMLDALMMSVMAGAATSVGGLAVCCINPQRGVTADILALTLGLAAGVMLAVSILELVVPSSAKGDGMEAFLWFVVGCFIYFLLASLARFCDSKFSAQQQTLVKSRERRSRRLGILMALALTAHNLPEGLAVVISASASRRSGAIVTLAIALHNIPEGLAIAVPLAVSGKKIALLATIASGFSEPLGAILGLLLLRYITITPDIIDHLEACVAGIMSAIALFELIPEARAQHRHRHTIFAFLSGWILISLTIWLVDSRPPLSHLAGLSELSAVATQITTSLIDDTSLPFSSASSSAILTAVS